MSEGLSPGTVLAGRYRVEHELGRGGIGVVYLALDEQLHAKKVVVKVLLDRPARGEHGEWSKRKFQQEVEALSRIDHPGVVGVLDDGTTPDGRPFFVMQYVEGQPLRSILSPRGLSLSRTASLMRQMGEALSAAHAKGVFHRDLKPENVMVEQQPRGLERIRIIDFGVARVERSDAGPTMTSGIVAGTLGYMSAEQLRSEPPTPASDVFALGVIAYEMLTGQPPFTARTVVDLYRAEERGSYPDPLELRPDLPAPAAQVLRKALSFEPKDRHPSTEELGAALAQALLGSAGLETPPGEPEPSHGPDSRGASSVEPDTVRHRGPAGVTPSSGAVADVEEPLGGAVPLDSAFYVVRPADEAFHAAIARQDSIVLLKGARQMGKTSLLARGLQRVRSTGHAVVLTDLQKLNAAQLESTDSLYRGFGTLMAEQLDIEAFPEDVWNPKRAPNVNFERYLRREVLSKVRSHLVWALDETDRLFSCPFASEVFGLFRSWHNERSLDPAGPWRRLTLAIAYATEAQLFITDMNQSPFNVGTRIPLSDFTVEEVAELNRRYRSPLRDAEELERFVALVGGQPYLVRRGLHALATQKADLARLERSAEHEEGPFADHLRRLLAVVRQDPVLSDVLLGTLRGELGPTPESFYRLRAAGILAGDSAREPKARCHLYSAFFVRALGGR